MRDADPLAHWRRALRLAFGATFLAVFAARGTDPLTAPDAFGTALGCAAVVTLLLALATRRWPLGREFVGAAGVAIAVLLGWATLRNWLPF